MNDKYFEDISLEDMYVSIDEDINVNYTDDLHGNTIALFDPKYRLPLHKIEEFVIKIKERDDLGFIIQKDQDGKLKKLTTLPLGHYYFDLKMFASLYSLEYQFSEHVTAFFESILAMGSMFNALRDADQIFTQRSLNEYIYGAEAFNDIVRTIRKKVTSPSFRKKLKARQFLSDKNFISATDYVDSLFNNYASLLVIRIDLSYQIKSGLNFDLELVKTSLNKLLNNMRCNKIFKSLLGYIWKFEFGETKGYHIHFIFFFDGSNCQNDYYYAKKIGEYWKNKITGGKGYFFNCNQPKNKSKYSNLAIGKILHHDFIMRKNLVLVIKYITKNSQYLRVKTNKQFKCFGHGQIDSIRSSKAGRPRTRF